MAVISDRMVDVAERDRLVPAASGGPVVKGVSLGRVSGVKG
jgi:hypothetical protein